MPARTNAFQKLVLHIHRQLGGKATVTESKALADLVTGREREVDVVIETDVAGHPVIVSVECVARGRPMDVEWVEQILQKHASLPTKALVLVSESGFTEAALEKARFGKAKVVSLDEALQLDWTTFVGKEDRIFLARYDYTPTDCFVFLRADGGAARHQLGPQCELFTAEGSARAQILQVARHFLAMREVGAELAQNLFKGDATEGDGYFELELPPGMFVNDSAGTPHEVLRLIVTFKGRQAMGPVDLSHGSMEGTPVSYGEGDTGFGRTYFVVAEPERGKVRGSFTFKDPATGAETTVPFTEADAPPKKQELPTDGKADE